jgi:hypothetical protein
LKTILAMVMIVGISFFGPRAQAQANQACYAQWETSRNACDARKQANIEDHNSFYCGEITGGCGQETAGLQHLEDMYSSCVQRVNEVLAECVGR